MSLHWHRKLTQIGDIEIFYVDLSSNEASEFKAFDMLCDSERERARRFRDWNSRIQFTLCRAALRYYLCEVLNCRNCELRINSSRNCKPSAYVNASKVDFEFNVSHTNGHGLIALTKNGRVGVDIEHRHVKLDLDGPIKQAFSAPEQRALERVEPQYKEELFLRIWTAKEALIKATGEGFRTDTASFSIPKILLDGTTDKIKNFYLPSVQDTEWSLVNLETISYAAVLAYEVV